MAIIRKPLASDGADRCTRWQIVLYNKHTGKQEWHTHRGTLRDAQKFERDQQKRLGNGTYIPKTERRTFAEVAEMFLKEREARARRAATLERYRDVLKQHLLADLGHREVGIIRRSDFADHFDAMRAKGASVSTVNRTLRVAKAVMFFALERELLERNPLQRFRPFEGGQNERHVARDAFSETELQAIINAARPSERALIGLLAFGGVRPGEAYALDWENVDLDRGTARIVRSWDHKGQVFNAPKTEAGERVIPLSGWMVAELQQHRERTGGQGLVFANGNGKPQNPSNLRRDVWLPLKKRAGVRNLDLYSLRHSFATMARTAGEGAHAVARMLGHSHSLLVDRVYAAHTLASGLTGVAEAVTNRALGLKPQLRVIEGGNQRDVRSPLEESAEKTTKEVETTKEVATA
jgi:integrase